jgi:hypothetical protein
MKISLADVGTPPPSSARPPAGRRAVLSLVTAVAALLVALVGAAPAASAATTPPAGRVTFGIEPATATGPDARPNFSFEMTPGAVLFDHVAVVNYSATALSLQLYATDALETSSGGFGLLPGTVTPTGVGAWISLPPTSSTVVVPAQTATGPGDVVVPMTVHVPASATPGDHVGGVIASLRTVGSNQTGQTVVLNQRIGTRVFIRVAGQLSPQLTLSGLHASYQGTANPFGTGKVAVTYTVSNSGNVNLAVHDQQVSVSGLIDDTHGARLGNIPLLLPGSAVTQKAVIAGVWPQFRLRQTASVLPVAYAGAQPDLSAVSASSTLWVVPWLLLVIILVIIVGIVVWVRRRRARRAAPPSGPMDDGTPDIDTVDPEPSEVSA